jgi:hypothetical protein
MRAAGNK